LENAKSFRRLPKGFKKLFLAGEPLASHRFLKIKKGSDVRQDLFAARPENPKLPTTGLPAVFLEPRGAQLDDPDLIVHSVQGLKPGTYFLRREHNTLEVLKEEEFRAEAYRLGLEQDLPADARVNIFFHADSKLILERYGNCGDWVVQLEGWHHRQQAPNGASNAPRRNHSAVILDIWNVAGKLCW
jgi:hypothetical protein